MLDSNVQEGRPVLNAMDKLSKILAFSVAAFLNCERYNSTSFVMTVIYNYVIILKGKTIIT